MITLFRRIRQKLIDSGSVTKYLFYAAGEILLVVLGILIALQINNWNEERKLDKTTRVLLKQIQLDLVENIEISTYLIRAYQRKDSVIWSMISQDLQPSDLEGAEGRRFKYAINSYNEVRLADNGYPKLLEHPGVKPGELSEILDQLKDLDAIRKYTNEDFDEIKEDRRNHIEYRKNNHAWFSSQKWEGIQSSEESDFYANDIRLKNYVTEYTNTYLQLLQDLTEYIQRALPLYELIQDELGEPRSEMPELIRNYYVELPEDALKKFTGSYSAFYIPDRHSLGTFNSIDSIQIFLDPEMSPVIKGFVKGEVSAERTLKVRSEYKLETGSDLNNTEVILNADGDIEVKEILGVNYVFKRKE